jgi:phospholipid-binding lipoprotein MlaA
VTTRAAAEVWDPIEDAQPLHFSINRASSHGDPPSRCSIATGCRRPVQKSVRNLLDNLGEPVTAINEVFQGDPSRR